MRQPTNSVQLDQNRRLLFILNEQFDATLDYLRLANAAQRCSSYFTSVLFLEKWHFRSFNQLKMVSAATAALTQRAPSPALAGEEKKKATAASRKPSAAGSGGLSSDLAAFQNLLLQAYKHMSEEPDSMYGVVACRESDRDVFSELLIAEHEGSWPKALQLYDFMFQQPLTPARTASSGTATAIAAGPIFSPPPPAASAASAGSIKPRMSPPLGGAFDRLPGSTVSLSRPTLHSGLAKSLRVRHSSDYRAFSY